MAESKPNKKAFDIHRNLPPKPSAIQPAKLKGKQKSQPAKTEQDQQKRRRLGFKKIVALALLILLIFVLIIGIWDARNISSATGKLFGSNNVLGLLNINSLKTDGNGRVNVLVVGYSADDPGHAGADLTDSILVVSMNPANHTGYMLSIPRDLYVDIPGNGHAKINEAYQDGGMGLLEQVIENDFQIQTDYYMIVDYSAVRDIVNSLGGITVTINSPDGRLYDPNKDWSTGGPLVDLTNGTHTLSGEQALDLTRARGDASQYGYAVGFESSDFQRTADQRLVFTAIKSRLNWKLMLDPRKNGQILNAIATNVKTDAQISDARPLFGLFNSIPTAQLQSLSLRMLGGKNYLSSYTTATGQSALIPAAGIDDYSQIDSALARLGQ